MKEKFNWMLEIADKKPLLFSVLLLLIGIAVLSTVVQNREVRLENCDQEIARINTEYKHRIDSITNYYADRDSRLNEEVKNTLKTIIEEYRHRLEEQKGVNDKAIFTINENKKIINQQKTSRE